MPLISDTEAARIEDEVAKCQDRATMIRWARSLLDDRKDRSALILSLSRQIHHARGRFTQAASYLDGLLSRAHDRTRQPWPRQIACEICGAWAETVAAIPTLSTGGHRLETRHPDGTACHPKARRE